MLYTGACNDDLTQIFAFRIKSPAVNSFQLERGDFVTCNLIVYHRKPLLDTIREIKTMHHTNERELVMGDMQWESCSLLASISLHLDLPTCLADSVTRSAPPPTMSATTFSLLAPGLFKLVSSSYLLLSVSCQCLYKLVSFHVHTSSICACRMLD